MVDNLKSEFVGLCLKDMEEDYHYGSDSAESVEDFIPRFGS